VRRRDVFASRRGNASKMGSFKGGFSVLQVPSKSSQSAHLRSSYAVQSVAVSPSAVSPSCHFDVITDGLAHATDAVFSKGFFPSLNIIMEKRFRLSDCF
jgi:hypothetical protein